jgi:hypothetical protein
MRCGGVASPIDLLRNMSVVKHRRHGLTGIAEVTGNHRLCPSPNILWLSAACLLFFC